MNKMHKQPVQSMQNLAVSSSQSSLIGKSKSMAQMKIQQPAQQQGFYDAPSNYYNRGNPSDPLRARLDV